MYLQIHPFTLHFLIFSFLTHLFCSNLIGNYNTSYNFNSSNSSKSMNNSKYSSNSPQKQICIFNQSPTNIWQIQSLKLFLSSLVFILKCQPDLSSETLWFPSIFLLHNCWQCNPEDFSAEDHTLLKLKIQLFILPQ